MGIKNKKRRLDVAGNNGDITEQQRLQFEAQSLSKFPEENPNPVMRVSSRVRLLYANYPAMKLLAALKWRAGRSLPGQIRSATQNAFKNNTRQKLELSTPWGQTYSFILVPIMKDGYANLYGYDITKSKRVEEEIIQAKEYAELLYKLVPSAIFTTDIHRYVTSWNKKAEELTGYTADEVIGKKCVIFSDAPCRDKCGLFSKNTKKPIIRKECLILRKDGQQRAIVKNADVLKDKNGAVIGGIESFEDISERKKAEEMLQKSRDELEQHVKERTAELLKATRKLGAEIIERRKVEKAVKAERQRLYEVLETLPVYVVLLDKDYHVPFANHFFRERFGESHGKRCYEYLFNRAEPCENCETYKVLKTKETHRWEWVGPDGRNYDIYDFPFTDSDGSTLIMEMGIDITKRKRAEEALQKAHDMLEVRVKERTAELTQSNIQLRSEIDERQKIERALREVQLDLNRAQAVANTGSWRLDVQRNELTWSDETYRIFGIQKETSLTYETFLLKVHPEDRDDVDRKWQAALRGEPYDIEHRIVVGDAVKWVHEQAELEFDQQGILLSGFGTVQDITKLKQAQAREKEALAIATAARTAMDTLQAMGEGVLLMDMNGHVVSINPAFKQLSGLQKNEVLGRPLMDFLLPMLEEKDKPMTLEAYNTALSGKNSQLQPLTLINKRGRFVPVIPTVSFIRAPDGKATAIILTVRDISEMRAMQQNLEENNMRLRALAARLSSTEERERHRISAQIHDTVIQTLSLANIKLGALLKELSGNDTEKSAASVKTVRATIEDAIRESRSLMAELTPPLLYELGLVPAINDLAQKLQKQHNTPIQVKDDEQSKPVDKAIQGILFQATRELILNALKHAGKCAITVTVSRGDDRLWICVEDNGSGFNIPENGRFVFRSNGGFGLFAIRGRLEGIGGSLVIRSQAGAGTSVSLFAPLA